MAFQLTSDGLSIVRVISDHGQAIHPERILQELQAAYGDGISLNELRISMRQLEFMGFIALADPQPDLTAKGYYTVTAKGEAAIGEARRLSVTGAK